MTFEYGPTFTAAAAFEDFYLANIAPAGVARDSLEYEDLRRTFYAALFVFLQQILVMADYSEEAGIDSLQALNNELRQFIKALA